MEAEGRDGEGGWTQCGRERERGRDKGVECRRREEVEEVVKGGDNGGETQCILRY